MRNRGIVWTCTLLGLVAGVFVSWFVSLKSGVTLEMWKSDLFVQPTWQGWVVCTATLIVPILVGLWTGLKKDNIAGIFLAPIFAILASAAALIIAAIALALMNAIEVVAFMGFVGFIAILCMLIPTGGFVVVVIFRG